jgi:4-amino-4-deoxy-L-arabinose transferase-like glycosyltransferase
MNSNNLLPSQGGSAKRMGFDNPRYKEIILQVLPVFLWFLSLVILIWALIDPQFRDGEGFLVGKICFPISVSAALVIAGWGIKAQLWKFTFWFTLAVLGQAAALQLIDAGKIMRYQHYKPFGRLLLETHPFLLVLLVVQILAVLYEFVKHWREIRDFLSGHFTSWQLVGVALVFVLSSATVSAEISRYAGEVIFAAFIQFINLGTVVLMVCAIPKELISKFKIWFERLFGSIEEEQAKKAPFVDRFILIASSWVVLVAAILSLFSYQRHPHIPDEVAYIYQARFLADGNLFMPSPPVKDGFEVYLMQFDGPRWYPAPPVGWPAALALGEMIGAGWLVNPILGGINIVLIYILISSLYNRRTARIAVFLLCLSPWYMFMAMNYMTHTFTLTTALVAALGVIWSRRTGHGRWAFLSGIALGWMSLIRPLEGLIWALLLGLWAIGIGGKRLKIGAIASMVLGAIMVGSLVLPYNQILTGKATLFPINLHTDQRFGANSNAYGFGPDRGMGWPIDPYKGHSPVDALINVNLNTFSINIELFGWGIGSLILVAIKLFSRSYNRSDLLMISILAAVFIAFFFYYFSGGPDFGARYWFLMIIPLVALSVRGIQYLGDQLAGGQANSEFVRTRILLAVFTLSIISLINYFPWRAIDKYFNYLGMRPDVRYIAQEYEFENSLVLIRGNEHPDYASAFVYNPVDLNSERPIYAWDRSSEVRAKLMEAFPDRQVWFIDGPSNSQSGYVISEGSPIWNE